MRKFLLKILIFAVYAVSVSVIIPVFLDPFNVFHAENIRANGVEPNKNYVKMKYILANPGKFDSFMLGSSRVGFIRTHKITGEKCYNMTYSNGLPGWYLLNIKTFLDNGIHPKKIYIGLDWGSYPVLGGYKAQVNDPICCPYEYLINDTAHFIKLYFDTSAAIKSLFFTFRSFHGRIERINAETFYEYGYGFGGGFALNFDWKNPPRRVSRGEFDIDLALGFIKETYDICRKNGIELVLFTHPMYYSDYPASVRYYNYFSFLEELAEISDFWNFSSINDITLNNANYIDTAHYRTNVGDLIIDIMCNGKSYHGLQAQGFGVKVTRENAKDFISMLRRQVEDYEKSHK